MKCEICGEEIMVIVEEERATLPNGRVDQGELGYIPRRSSPLLRCGCYDCEGHPDCDYHIAEEMVVRNDPPPPGPFDDLIRVSSEQFLSHIFTTPPFIDSLRDKG